MSIIKVDYGDISGGEQTVPELFVYVSVAGTKWARFNPPNIESFRVKCTSIETTSYKPYLEGYNGSAWVTIKTWSAVDTDFVDMYNNIKDYTYIRFATSTNSWSGQFQIYIRPKNPE